MDFEGNSNVFLRAAMTGEVTPYTSLAANTAASSSAARSSSTTLTMDPVKKGKTQRLSFSKAEDILIQAAFGHHKSDYRAMVRFIAKHLDILPQDSRLYYQQSQQSASKSKAAEERVRKRVASKLLKASSSQAMKTSKKTKVEDEYAGGYTLGDEDEGETGEDNDDEIESDEESFLGEINKRKRYLPPRTASTTGQIRSSMEKSSNQERKDAGKSSRGKSKKKKIEESLPQLLESVKEAAEAHTKALKKWESTFQGDDSD